MDLTERKLKILQAVIADFVRTAEPVGSRTISKNYSLGSPAGGPGGAGLSDTSAYIIGKSPVGEGLPALRQ